MRFLVTAGNTREAIDRVRDWGNIFTGNTGYRIARAIAEAGVVDLVSSNRSHLAELEQAPPTSGHRIFGHAFISHAQLRDCLSDLMSKHRYDAIFMSAAVADYRPAGAFAVISRQPLPQPGQEQWIVQNVDAGKITSTHDQIAILGQQTEKIVDLFRREWNYRGLLVKFKLEVGLSPEELIRVADTSRKASGADYLVANTLDMVEGPRSGAYLVSDQGAQWVARDYLPRRMFELVRG